MIHYWGTNQPHYQLLFCLLANAIERRSWEAKSREVFSDPSCNGFTQQLPLILCTATAVQALKYNIICFIIAQLLWTFMALNFFSSCTMHFPTKLVQPAAQGVRGRKNGPWRGCNFLFSCRKLLRGEFLAESNLA